MPKAKRKGPTPNLAPWQVEKMIDKAKRDASNDATSMCLTLMLSVLLDKFGGEDYIKDVYDAWNERAAGVLSGEIKLHEWRDVLRKEYGIDI